MKIFMFLLMSVLSNMVYAEIIHTDIYPDSTISGSLQNPWANYELDLDNDGSPDFVITHFFPDQNLYYVEMCGNQYKSCEILVDDQMTPKALDFQQNIDNLQSAWYDTKTTALHMRRFWIGAKDKYLGLRIRKNNNWIYGWARLDIAGDESSFTIKDYAYESVLDSGLTAGELISSVSYPNNHENYYSISPNPASDYIEISYPPSEKRGPGGVSIRIVDILGIEQPTSPQPLSMLGEGVRIDVSSLPPGVYFVSVGDVVRKFVKI